MNDTDLIPSEEDSAEWATMAANIDSESGGRHSVEVQLDEELTNDEALAILCQNEDFFEFLGTLVKVFRKEGRLTIQSFEKASLRERLAHAVAFFKHKTTKDGAVRREFVRVPDWCVAGLIARRHWPQVRQLQGLASTPVLRADGTIAQIAGFDPQSGILLDLQEDFPAIPEFPSRVELQAAVQQLWTLVEDFPFLADRHRAGWIAALLTPLARSAYHGPTGPLFLFDSNIRGSGKSLLTDLISLIVEGREAARLTAPDSDEEFRKRITALAVEGTDRLILLDNLEHGLGCASLDAALTGEYWQDRVLQESRTVRCRLPMTWLASGNNTVLKGDTSRRVCLIRLESPLEHPEDRSNFRYPDIKSYVREHRQELLAAALIVLRAYFAAGRPDMELPAWGSFEGWSSVVRGAMVFAGLPDPAETKAEVRNTADSEADGLRAVVSVLPLIDSANTGLTANQLIDICKGNQRSHSHEDVADLRSAVELFTGVTIDKLSPVKLGNRLGRFQNRVCGGVRLDFRVSRGQKYWRVIQNSPGSGGDGDHGEVVHQPDEDSSVPASTDDFF